MPPMNYDQVKVLPVTYRSSATLEEVLNLLKQSKPDSHKLLGGWANREGKGVPLRLPGGTPPDSDPEIFEATNDLPEMLVARYYYWEPATSKDKMAPNFIEAKFRLLNALDLVITKPSESIIGVLISTRSNDLVRRRDGALKNLEKILQSLNKDAKLVWNDSHLALLSEDIFLWLAVSLRDNPLILPSIELGGIDALTSRDVGSRSTDLKAGVDFSRSAFLTSVADGDVFGPVDISFAHHHDSVTESYKLQLFVDGGFAIRKKDLHLEDQLNRPQLMFEATLNLAFSIIPEINRLFVDSLDEWKVQRLKESMNAMQDLEQRYGGRVKMLEAKTTT